MGGRTCRLMGGQVVSDEWVDGWMGGWEVDSEWMDGGRCMGD